MEKTFFHHGKPRALWGSKTGLSSLIILIPQPEGNVRLCNLVGPFFFFFHFSEEGSEIKFGKRLKTKAQRNRLK